MEARNRKEAHHDKASLSCVLSAAAFGTPARSYRSRGDRNLQERSMWVQQTFESAVLLDQFPRSSIRIFIQILQNDGGGIAAGINAATLALADAGIPMRDLVTACSTGLLQGRPAMDLSREEEMAGGAQLLAACLA